jgi:serpin B
MAPIVRSLPRSRGRTLVALLAVSLLITGCADTPRSSVSAAPATSSPSPSMGDSPVARTPATTPAEPPSSTSAPTADPAASLSPGDAAKLLPGALAITVTDDLRVRSQPRVAEASLKFSPLLPKGTQLVVIGGPTEGSGFSWLEVAPVGLSLRGDVDSGWVAIADHDGTPWVAPAADDTPGYELASVQLDRPAPRLADAKAAAVAQNAFGIALYKRMLKDPVLNLADKGVVTSPYSIVTALAMARAGAKGDTAAEMDKVLRVADWDRLGAGLNALDQELTSRDASWTDYEDKQHWLQLRTANMGFVQDGYPIDPVYLERVAETFGAGTGLVDYIRDRAGALAAINSWVSRQTVGRIPKLLEPKNVTKDTRLVLVNAIYLKAEWARPFEPGATHDRKFTTLSGKTVTVPTMNQLGEQDIVLARGDGWKATELRYAGAMDGSRPLAMTLILPDDLRAFERSLTPATLAGVQSVIRAEGKRLQKVTYPAKFPDSCGQFAYDVDLYLPKFGTDTRASLKSPLVTLGMPTAFDRDLADFSGMTEEDRLHIGDVIHQANVDVDEQGTTASAATAVLMETGGCTGPDAKTTKVLRFDKPFLYVIRDVETGAILFMGRVVDPTQRS